MHSLDNVFDLSNGRRNFRSQLMGIALDFRPNKGAQPDA
jgi:hypothetical protein